MTLPSSRWLWAIAASFSLLAILSVGSRYADWKTARLRQSAAHSIENERPVEAALEAASALQIVPGDPELTRILGNAYDATNDERLLDVLAQQIEHDPDSLAPRFRLARAAMRFGRLDLSSATVANMPPEADATTDFHEIGSALASLSKHGDRLLEHARQLYKLEPENQEHLLKLAGLSVLASKFTLGQDELAGLRELHGQSVDATVLLWAISRLPDYPGSDAAELESELLPTLAGDQVAFQTRLQALDLAAAIGEKRPADQILTLLKTKTEEVRDLDEIGVIIAWLNDKDDPAGALAWCRQLDLFSGEKPPANLAVVLADTCARNSAWDELDWVVTGSDWGRGDFLRNFYAAKCATERPSPTADLKRESFLRLVLKDSSNHPAQIHLLWRNARKYGWRDLTQPLSWQLVKLARTLPERHAILESIASEALETGDLAEFRRVTKALLKTSPGQWELRNNDYYLSLLIDGCDTDQLAEIKAFHDEFQIHPDVKTTYAFALHQSGDSEAAAEIIGGLDESVRDSPSVAPFCALIFSATGDSTRAEHFRSLPHQLFFSEEKTLLATVQ